MTFLFTDEEIRSAITMLKDYMSCIKNPIINKVSFAEDFIKFWKPSLLFDITNWNIIVFLKDNLTLWDKTHTCSAENQPALTHFN